VPASLAFPKTPVGNTYSKNLTVKNTGYNPLFISSVASSHPAEFAVTANTCPAGGLAHGLTCTITAAFTPSALGARVATLTLSDNGTASPQHVALSGTGTADITLTKTSLVWGSEKVGMLYKQGFAVVNHQSVAVTLSESFSGPNAGDFSVAGGTCGTSLNPLSSCSILVGFRPGALGSESATITVTASPDPLGPEMVALSTASTLPETVLPTKVSFGKVAQSASRTRSVTVTNYAATPITLGGATLSGANASDFAVGGTCGATLAGTSSCTYAVTFTPATETAESATLSVAVTEDPASPRLIALAGTGLSPIKALPLAGQAYGTVTVGKSLARYVTVYNSGAAAVSISESISGPNAADFTVTGGTCGATLAGASHCNYQVTFTPSIVGAESATVAVSASGDAASPHDVSLSGTGG
jgi:HYDIN/CFA65/VesB-like, Ig-like domain/Cep192 domain 4